MTDMKATARTVVAAAALGAQAKAVEKAAKAELLELCGKTGATTLKVKDDDGTALATISMSEGRKSADVTNETALLAWVRKNRPDHIRETVADGYVKSLLKLALENGAAVDEDTGEVIPGIDVSQGDPYISATTSAAAKERMGHLLRGSGLLELTGGDTDGA
jgi:hypothetical protein